jgi:hypothetical protein
LELLLARARLSGKLALHVKRCLWFGCLIGIVGCSDSEEDSPLREEPQFCDPSAGDPFAPIGPPTAEPLSEEIVGASTCAAVEREFTIEGASHVEDCSSVTYGSNPPSSGTHYQHWASFRVYDSPLPRGFWVHSMEHGAVVIAYSCEDCDDEVESARALIDSLPVDPLCSGSGPSRRLILTPDPLLETAWAAAAWGHTLTSDCFESDIFRAFVEAHYGAGPEQLCADGVFTSP